MGGDYIPRSFTPAPEQVWQRLSTVISKDDWYRFVLVTQYDAKQLLLRDGHERTFVTINDNLIEVFQVLKDLDGDSAVAFDRLLHRCWFTTNAVAEPFLDYSMTVDDEFCTPAED